MDCLKDVKDVITKVIDIIDALLYLVDEDDRYAEHTLLLESKRLLYGILDRIMSLETEQNIKKGLSDG